MLQKATQEGREGAARVDSDPGQASVLQELQQTEGTGEVLRVPDAVLLRLQPSSAR